MDPKLYKAARKGDVSYLPKIVGRNITVEDAMRIPGYGRFLTRTQHGNNNILHIAARAGRDTFITEALWRFPFLSVQVNSQGDTPLLVAARFGHLQVVETLADPNNELPMQDDIATTVESGQNLRSSRHQLGQRTIQDNVATLDNGTNSRDMTTAPDNETNSSSHHRPRDVEEGLDDRQLDVPIPSHWRVTNLELGATITTALHEALRNGHQNVAQYLLRLKPEMAAFLNFARESPLFLAAESCCELFMLDILLSERPYSTKGPNGLNALHASRDCCGEIVSLLIKKNPDLMRQLDGRGKAAIHHAVEAYCLVLLDQMLIADASIALFPDAEGYTPLLRAASRGNWEFCKLILMRCPESIEARNLKGQNALHLGKVELSSAGFDGEKIPEMWELLNVGDNEGNTPLHLAVEKNQYEKALFLTSSASIDLGAVNNEGLTALDLCESDCEHFTVKRQIWFHLRRHGARRGRQPNKHMLPRRGPNMFLQYPPDEDWKPYVNTTALIAILITTITFAAAFAMPGGYDTNSDNLGGPTLVKRAALRVFILSDTLAMCCSITAVCILTAAMHVQQNALPPYMAASWLCLNIALLSTLMAFMSGMFAVLAKNASWVAILVCIVCSMPPFLLNARRHEMSPFTWFMPILPRDILLTIRKRQQMKKRTKEQSDVRSRIPRPAV
ncbi:hypothetical protein RHSIM_Rhsim04G0034200 [Rhododendron simsii]|uniref:PGG domain-containing protein n=1 Tax=Rhododendron simsii TaxID=118357 RepID=A0A834LS80_RHOSS|nr:hypothetical protein RHSIM_Rhsim04G0034200 [Rhododendron simsii]